MKDALRTMIHAAADLHRELEETNVGKTTMGGVLRALCIMMVDVCDRVVARFDDVEGAH